MDRTCKQLEGYEENGNDKETSTSIIKGLLKSLEYIMRKEDLENVTLTRHTENRRSRRKHRVALPKLKS